jgi:uncharacterized protein GlcG (DUF336 family)
MPAVHQDSATRLDLETLELRDVPAAVAGVAGNTLFVTGDAANDRILVSRDGSDLIVLDRTTEIGRFASDSIAAIDIDGGAGNDVIKVGATVTQGMNLIGNDGNDKLVAGGGGAALDGGTGNDSLFGGPTSNAFNGDGGRNDIYNVLSSDVVFPSANDRVLAREQPPSPALQQTMTAQEVDILLQRAAAASASNDAIIAIVDRNGRILGVRVEGGVDPAITSNPATLVFAVDGAVAKARTGAFFGNNQAPLTSRTVQFISQSTITEREVNSNPSITDPNSPLRGPGFVAPVNIAGHFPPGIAFTPQVDLFAIEHTNRDSSVHPGPDRIKGTADDVPLPSRFNIPLTSLVPGQLPLVPPDSYGVDSGMMPTAQNRGIATLPGGVPIFKNGQVVGGIGVFFPGKTGFATEENSGLSTTYDKTKPDRTLEAEWMAFAAVGGTNATVSRSVFPTPIFDVNGVPLPAGFGLPVGRIDLVGIQLDIFGQGGIQQGVERVMQVGRLVGRGDRNSGTNLVVDADGNDDGVANDPLTLRAGQATPEGWIVAPRDGVGISAAEVQQIISQGLIQANLTRAAIRLPLGTRAKFVFAVADREGNIVGLFRQPDATIFSIDVAVAKARNAMYYADPAQLQPIDQIDGVPAGTAFTARTFRFASLPHFPEGIDFAAPGPFSQLNDDPRNTSRQTGKLVGQPLPASAYQSVLGFDAFNPGTNFRQPGNILNQNGIVFFPGSAPLYRRDFTGQTGVLIGGFGVSGDGVDQDDVTTVAGQTGFDVPDLFLRADEVFVNGIRLPYQKFNRNPEG